MKLTEKQVDKMYDIIEKEMQDVDNVDVEDTYMSGSHGYSVDWYDREGRHPWVQVDFQVDFEKMLYNVDGNIGDKAGTFDIARARRARAINSDLSIEEIPEWLECIVDDICHDLENMAR